MPMSTKPAAAPWGNCSASILGSNGANPIIAATKGYDRYRADHHAKRHGLRGAKQGRQPEQQY